MSGGHGFYRGTTHEQMPFFANKEKKMLSSKKWPECFNHQVDLTKVRMEVLKPWISARITELLGVEDDIVIDYCIQQLSGEGAPEDAGGAAGGVDGCKEGVFVDPRTLQINLTGFMERKAAVFMKELWLLLLSAQSNPLGIPQKFLQEKESELEKRVLEQDAIKAELESRRANMEEYDRRHRSASSLAKAEDQNSTGASKREEQGGAPNGRMVVKRESLDRKRSTSGSEGVGSPGRRRRRNRDSSDHSMSGSKSRSNSNDKAASRSGSEEEGKYRGSGRRGGRRLRGREETGSISRSESIVSSGSRSRSRQRRRPVSAQRRRTDSENRRNVADSGHRVDRRSGHHTSHRRGSLYDEEGRGGGNGTTRSRSRGGGRSALELSHGTSSSRRGDRHDGRQRAEEEDDRRRSSDRRNEGGERRLDEGNFRRTRQQEQEQEEDDGDDIVQPRGHRRRIRNPHRCGGGEKRRLSSSESEPRARKHRGDSRDDERRLRESKDLPPRRIMERRSTHDDAARCATRQTSRRGASNRTRLSPPMSAAKPAGSSALDELSASSPTRGQGVEGVASPHKTRSTPLLSGRSPLSSSLSPSQRNHRRGSRSNSRFSRRGSSVSRTTDSSCATYRRRRRRNYESRKGEGGGVRRGLPPRRLQGYVSGLARREENGGRDGTSVQPQRHSRIDGWRKYHDSGGEPAELTVASAGSQMRHPTHKSHEDRRNDHLRRGETHTWERSEGGADGRRLRDEAMKVRHMKMTTTPTTTTDRDVMSTSSSRRRRTVAQEEEDGGQGGDGACGESDWSAEGAPRRVMMLTPSDDDRTAREVEGAKGQKKKTNRAGGWRQAGEGDDVCTNRDQSKEASAADRRKAGRGREVGRGVHEKGMMYGWNGGEGRSRFVQERDGLRKRTEREDRKRLSSEDEKMKRGLKRQKESGETEDAGV